MKAVIQIGGKQYIVAERETILVDRLEDGSNDLTLDPLLVIDGDVTKIGSPKVVGAKVTAKVVEPEVKTDKVKVIRFESKKRVKKINGHRQRMTKIEVTAITLK